MICQRGNGFGVFGIATEYTAQQIDQFFLHFAGPVTGHQITDGFHGIRTGQSSGQVSRAPCVLAHDGGGYVFVRRNFTEFNVGIFDNVLGVTGQIFEERHVVGAGRFRSQSVKFRAVGDNPALKQVRQFHGSVDYIGVEQFRNDNIRNFSNNARHIFHSFSKIKFLLRQQQPSLWPAPG